MFRHVRVLVVAVAAAALVGIGTGGVAPSGAGVAPVTGSGIAYTVEFQVPNGIESDSCRLSTIDMATGTVTPVAPFVVDQLGCAFDLALSPGGGLYGIADLDGDEVDPPSVDESTPTTEAPVTPAAVPDQVHLVRFDTSTGGYTDLGPIGTAASRVNGGGGLTFDSSGNLYVYMIGDDAECDEAAFCLYRVDPANPADATYLGQDPVETYLYGLTTACNAGLYTIEQVESGRSIDAADDVFSITGGDQLDIVDPTPPAQATAVGGLIGRGRSVQSLDFASDGTLWGLGATTPLGIPSAQLSVLDPATGVQTMGPLLSSDGEVETVVFGLAISSPSCPVEIQPNFTG